MKSIFNSRLEKLFHQLESLGYKTFEVWECETKNKALLSCNVSAIFDYLVRAQNFKIPT